MSIEGEDTTSVTHLTSDLNRIGSWGLTLENDSKNQRNASNNKKYIACTVLVTFFIVWGCLTTYLISEINHLRSEITQVKYIFERNKDSGKKEALSISKKFNTKIVMLDSMANDVNMKSSHLKILVNMQSERLSAMEGKLDRIKGQININTLRNDHLQKAMETNMLKKDRSQAKLFVDSLDEESDNTSNITLHNFKKHVVELINASQIMSSNTLLTFKNLTDDKIDEMKIELNDLKLDLDRISNVFDGWRTSEDEGKLYIDLKQTVDRLKLSVTRKYKSCNNQCTFR